MLFCSEKKKKNRRKKRNRRKKKSSPLLRSKIVGLALLARGKRPPHRGLVPTLARRASLAISRDPPPPTVRAALARGDGADAVCGVAQAERPLGAEPAQPALANRGRRAAATARGGSSSRNSVVKTPKGASLGHESWNFILQFPPHRRPFVWQARAGEATHRPSKM